MEYTVTTTAIASPSLFANKNQRLFVSLLFLLVNSLIIAAYDLYYLRLDFEGLGLPAASVDFDIWSYKVEFAGMISLWAAFLLILISSNNNKSGPSDNSYVYHGVAFFVIIGFILYFINIVNNLDTIRLYVQQGGEYPNQFMDLGVAYWFASFVTIALMFYIVVDCMTEVFNSVYARLTMLNTIGFIFMAPYLAYSIRKYVDVHGNMREIWSSEIASICSVLCIQVVVYVICCLRLQAFSTVCCRMFISGVYILFVLWFWISNAFIFNAGADTDERYIPTWLYCGLLLQVIAFIIGKEIMDVMHTGIHDELAFTIPYFCACNCYVCPHEHQTCKQDHDHHEHEHVENDQDPHHNYHPVTSLSKQKKQENVVLESDN